MLNGDGLRVVLWVAGCDHCCKECHNPVTWDPNGGLFFDEKAKAEIFEELEKDYISGITFSGGDPLHSANAYEVMMLAKEIKEKFPSKTIWLYTGYEWKDIKNMDIVNYLDVLVDGEFEVEKKELDLHWKGSANQMVINVPENLLLVNMRPVEGENAVMLQLREIGGKPATFSVTSDKINFVKTTVCDVVGDPVSGNPLSFAPWENKFIKLSW